ncbi:CRISPR-associated protein Cas4 [Sulfoacidibacillus thermotolerans]|uniref:CRISPR-associated exonuclease Cas4 n=1 Tax=Sulfoacidibacillus thermotolerans TaxID=1765684 RepID=A0A2U3D6V3_SULT2|nr:CRISPR-associated protein Cas4 [Sulfoacidibacillus thermotolerans]PWI57014.1 CRISPR-associated protein Cas4 [Sulfoacidibacillus thermotolerans]
MVKSIEDVRVTGTLVWYFCVCPREAWLMSHQLTPDEDDENIRIGRMIHEDSFGRAEREAAISGSKIDRVVQRDGKLVVYEVKKSSRHERSARMQLLFYLLQLREAGVLAIGELHYPEEKRVVKIQLGDEELREIMGIITQIRDLIARDLPPSPTRIPVCKKYAYAEFCWA